MKKILKKTFTMERQIFEKDGFRIVSATDDETMKKSTIKGDIPFDEGVSFLMEVEEKHDERYGLQYDVKAIFDFTPDEKEFTLILKELIGQQATPKFFGKYPNTPETFHKLLHNELDFTGIKHLGDKNIARAQKKLNEKFSTLILVALLKEFTITESIAKKLLKKNKSIKETIRNVIEDPHALKDLPGVGFKRAHQIAFKVDKDRPIEENIASAAAYALSKNEKDGSTFMKMKPFKQEMADLLKMNDLDLSSLHENENFIITDKIVAFSSTARVEEFIATKIDAKMKESHPFPLSKVEVDDFIDTYQAENDITFTETQRELIHQFTENNVSALLGYAGTGKSALQRIVTKLAIHVGWTVCQAAPTGRASRVMTEYTGLPSQTIHKTFGIGITKRRVPPYPGRDTCEADILLIDESSMIDTFMAEYMMAGVDRVKRILFVGDPEQLPSVGAGKFLHDITQSGVPHVELRQVFRQSEGGILDMATKARQTVSIVPHNTKNAVKIGKDSIFHEVEKENVGKAIMHYVTMMTKKTSLNDIIVVTPKNTGATGTIYLNKIIQEKFNPPAPNKTEVEGQEYVYRLGDTVMCTENTELDGGSVNNGEIGVITGFLKKPMDNGFMKSFIEIDFSGQIVHWPYTGMSTLSLGYAITIHKMQGSSAKVIIMVADKSNTYMLNRQLVYTGITRAKKRFILIGDAFAINRAIKKDGASKRNTLLPVFMSKTKNKENGVHQHDN